MDTDINRLIAKNRILALINKEKDKKTKFDFARELSYIIRDNADSKEYVDQYFTDGTNVFLTEMKIRDDHDSTKKRGQYDNFRKKISLVRKQHPNAHIDASMWFVDPGLIKNKNYYRDEMSKENFSNVSLHLYYGSEFFASLNNGMTVWNELISLLKEYRLDNADTNVEIPDFGTSEEIYNALLHISSKHWKKLNSELEEIVQLRAELFSNGDNLEKALKKRPL